MVDGPIPDESVDRTEYFECLFDAFCSSIPYFVTLIEDALKAVPVDQKEASLALGANMTSTLFRVLIPQARSGILNAIILGTNRIIGETMVVLMIAGGATMIPQSIFDPVRPLTAAIAGEMGEVELASTHYFALFMIGVVLLMISLIFTVTAMRLKRGMRR
jgi:phosphate transport system permease protein